MHRRRLIAASFAFLGILCISGSQAEDPANPTPGGIRLLPGYQHQKEVGKDTRIGKIWNEAGLTLRYDIGRGAGNMVKGQEKTNVLWSKEQVVDGHPVHLALTKDRMLFVTFPETSANFYAKTKSDEEVVEILLMVLTYAPPATPK